MRQNGFQQLLKRWLKVLNDENVYICKENYYKKVFFENQVPENLNKKDRHIDNVIFHIFILLDTNSECASKIGIIFEKLSHKISFRP